LACNFFRNDKTFSTSPIDKESAIDTLKTLVKQGRLRYDVNQEITMEYLQKVYIDIKDYNPSTIIQQVEEDNNIFSNLWKRFSSHNHYNNNNNNNNNQ